MKQILLSGALILVPVLMFFGASPYFSGAEDASSGLGDLSGLTAIAADVGSIAATGDLTAAEARARDLEKAWDESEPDMRPLDPAAWARVDDAADTLFHALRAAAPVQRDAVAAAVALQLVLADPTKGTDAIGPAREVAGIAVTDDSGHPLPCEEMLSRLRGDIAAAPPAPDALTVLTDLQAKATERCNADDDARADAFTAQALALLEK